MTTHQGHAASDLQNRAVRGGVFSLANQLVKTVVNLAAPLIFAVYLGPEEFGVIGIALSVQALVMVLRDGGFANALIQKRDTTEADFSSVFWLSTTLAVAMAAAVVAAAGYVASYYNEPRLAPILWLTALPILAQGCSAVHESRLRGDMSFARIFVADSGSTVLGASAAIVALLYGAGIWALVVRMVTTPILLAIGFVALSKWRPRLLFRPAAIRGLWSYGGYLFLTTLVGFAMLRLDAPIIAKQLGAAGAGVFFLSRTVALDTLRLGVGSISRVLFPLFSAIQDDEAAIRFGYLRITRYLAMLVFPLVAATIVVAPEVVPLLPGDRWHEAILPIQLIALIGVPICLNNPAAQILYARGRTRLQFAYSAVVAVLVITSFVVGCYWGVLGVAVTFTAVRLACSPVVLVFAAREIDLPIRRVLRNVATPLVCAAGSGIAAALAGWLMHRAGYDHGLVSLSVVVLAWLACTIGLSAWKMGDTLSLLWCDVTRSGLGATLVGRFRFHNDRK